MTVFSTGRTLPIVRSHVIDAQTEQIISRLAEVFPAKPMVILNGEKPDMTSGDYSIASLGERNLASWGVKNAPDHWGWFCGDYCYYRAAEVAGDFDHYLLIEQDVLITGDALSEFVFRLKLQEFFHAGASKLANDLAEPAKYSRDLLKLNRSDRVACIFPLTIASWRQIELMKRLRLAADHKGVQINDEAIFASSAFEHDVWPINFSKLMPDMFAAECFETNPPHLYEGLLDAANPAFWHPVVTHDLVLRRIETGEKRYSRHRLRNVLREAPAPLRASIKQKLEEAQSVS